MIPNQWYAILPSKKVSPNKVYGLKRLNLNLVLFRDSLGTLGCISSRCVHRGTDLAQGKIIQGSLACPFHGIRYDIEGRCTFIPSMGKYGLKELTRFNIEYYHVKEKHGIIFIWNGTGDPQGDISFFDEEISEKSVYSEIEDLWHTFYSRCIENQLDVMHLPFVYFNTIGIGNKTLVNGPRVLFENNTIQLSADNEVDTGQEPRKAEDCVIKETYLKFKFPNIWLNHISNNSKVLIFFAPVDDEHTVLYIRFYSDISKSEMINNITALLGSIGNRIIEKQDKRVVVTQIPKKIEYRSGERLLPGDNPVILYRKIREKMIENP